MVRRNIKIGTLSAHPINRIGDNTEERLEEAKHGGKIVLPPSALSKVAHAGHRLMVFKLINEKLNQYVFCGVFTFDGEEKKVLVPLWILKQLRINSGENVAVEYLARPLEKGHFAKFEPLSKNFLDITDPKTVLEHCMRMYVCISRHHVISIYYNRRVYELRITETLPDDTISIVDTDLEVDFAQIKGEKEQNTAIDLPEAYDLEKIQSESNDNSFRPFSGVGQRLDDKPILPGNNHQTSIQKNDLNDKRCKRKAIPDYDYKICTIQFKRYKKDLIPSVDSVKPERLSLKSIAQKQQSNSSEQMSQIQSQPRRPFTRSEAAMLRAQQNTTNSNQMSTNSTNTQKQSNESNTCGNGTKKKKTSYTVSSSSSRNSKKENLSKKNQNKKEKQSKKFK